MQANGQCQQAGQLQLTHPHPNYNASASNRGYENNSSYNGVGALVGHYPMHNVGVKQQSTQRQNNFLALNNPLPASSHQNYYPNSTQITANQNNTPTFSLNQQVMFAKKPSMPRKSQSANPMSYYQSHFKFQKTSNQSVNSRTENVSIPMTNPSTSSTMQHMSYTQQSAVQSPMYSQTSQQAVSAPYAPPYTQNINVAFSNVPVLNAQNAQIYSITPGTPSTSCFNEVVANNQSAQNNYFVSKTNSSCSVNGSTPLSVLMVPNNTNSQTNSLTAVPVQIQYVPFQGQKQTSVRGNINMQITQPGILSTNDNNGLNTLTAPLPSQTYLQKNVNAAPLQTTMPTKDQSFHQVGNALFYQKMNDVLNSSSLCPPLNQASELSRCETSAKDKDCSLQVSPGRAARAVAVVLPLSQESSASKPPSPSSLPSSNPASGSCFFTSKYLDKAPVQTPNTLCLNLKVQQKLQQSTTCSNISDKANAQTPSPSRDEIQLSMDDTGTKLATLPLTFAQLVEGNCSAKLSGRQKSKSGNKKTPKEQKLPERSSVPTTEWTLKMLYERILELENKDNEHKSETTHDTCDSVKQLLYRFWNDDCKALLHEAKTGRLSKEMSSIKDFCSKIDIDTVILSQNQSNHPSRYHVLLHDEVYAEKTSYTSSWLNIKPLDDIDEEFGLPYVLKYGNNRCKSVDAEPKHKIDGSFKTEVKSAIPKSEECKSKEEEKEDPSKMLPAPISSIPLVNSLSNNTDEENHNASAHSHPDPEERVEENECVPNAQLDDSSYSFKIEVLHPEEAKVIFEQTECDSPQMVDAAVSEEIPQSDQDGAESQTCHVSTLEKICCIEKWKENVFGLSSDGKCKCKEENQNEEKLGQFENKNCWLMGTVDLTEDDDFPLLTTKSENIQEDKSPNKTTFTVSSESEDESQVPATQTDAHNEHEEDLVISTESQLDGATNESLNSNDQDTNNHISDNSNVIESEMTTSDKSLENVRDCRKEPEGSGAETANPASPQPVCTSDDVKENNKRIASDIFGPLMHPSKKPKLSSHFKSQTILESFAKCRNGKRVETVELALFGSSHKKCASDGSQQSHVRSSQTNAHHPLFGKTEEAPRRVYVKFSPFTKSDKQEAEPSGNISVKERVHEKWRKSFPLTTIRLKRKNKKFSIVGGTHGRTLHLKRNKHKDKCVTPKRKTQDSDGQFCEKTSCNDGKTLDILKKPVDEVRPLQENVLKFNVLPNTFNFKEGSNDTDCRTYSQADGETVPAEGSPPAIKTKGVWCDESTSKSSPQSPAPVPESSGLFQEFQRRYKMRQASTDE